MSHAAAGTKVKGWCPGALRPMASGDGLIVRLKIGCGVVGLDLAHEIARWSRACGNGQIDLTNRANFQLRGVSVATLGSLRDDLEHLGLLDADERGEAVRNVIAAPLTGLDPDAVLDVRPVASALERRLAHDASLHDLPAKFGFAIDDGGRLSLDDVAADIHFTARPSTNGPCFDVRVAGGGDTRLGPCRPDAVVDSAAALGRSFLRFRGKEGGLRRMADLVASVGARVVATDAGLSHAQTDRSGARSTEPSQFLGATEVGCAGIVGVGLPFGRISADDLTRLGSVALEHAASELRLTPWRMILVPVSSIESARSLEAQLAGPSFILERNDPLRRIAACVGAPACRHATTTVRSHAAMLSAGIASAPGTEVLLHLSGCDKGCAHPRPAPVTLVGRNGQYDLVVGGAPWDAPTMRGLQLNEAREHMQRLVAAA